MTAGILVNLHRPDAIEAAQKAVSILQSFGHQAFVEKEAAAATGLSAMGASEMHDCDLLISIGGDGTLLRAGHLCAAQQIPILGVAYGTFGFITPCQPNQMEEALLSFIEGRHRTESRMMVQTHLIRADKVVAELHALNESVVQRSATTRLLVFTVLVNGYLVARYPADGVMVATPTGSTAYSLSAGGPVVDPRLEALLVTGLMPHTLSARPLVLPADSTIEIQIHTRGESHGGAVLSSDGQSRLHLLSGDKLVLTRSPRRVKLVTLEEDDFLQKLPSRLNWAGGKGFE